MRARPARRPAAARSPFRWAPAICIAVGLGTTCPTHPDLAIAQDRSDPEQRLAPVLATARDSLRMLIGPDRRLVLAGDTVFTTLTGFGLRALLGPGRFEGHESYARRVDRSFDQLDSLMRVRCGLPRKMSLKCRLTRIKPEKDRRSGAPIAWLASLECTDLSRMLFPGWTKDAPIAFLGDFLAKCPDVAIAGSALGVRICGGPYSEAEASRMASSAEAQVELTVDILSDGLERAWFEARERAQEANSDTYRANPDKVEHFMTRGRALEDARRGQTAHLERQLVAIVHRVAITDRGRTMECNLFSKLDKMKRRAE